MSGSSSLTSQAHLITCQALTNNLPSLNHVILFHSLQEACPCAWYTIQTLSLS